MPEHDRDYPNRAYDDRRQVGRAITAARNEELAAKVNAEHAAGQPSGFSVYASGSRAGDVVENAYMVGGAGAPEQRVPAEPARGRDLSKYQRTHAEALSRPNTAFGGWGSPDESYLTLDASTVVDRPGRPSMTPSGRGAMVDIGPEAEAVDTAMRLGSERGEDAIGRVNPGGGYGGDIPIPASGERIHLTARGRIRAPWAQ